MPGWEIKPPTPLPEREPGEPDYAFWMRALPKPPFGTDSDDMVSEWLRAAFRVGGPPALEWLWEPLNWTRYCKLSSPMRARMFHMREVLLREFEDDHRRRVNQIDRERRQAEEQAIDEAARKAGWA
jgi:hypothetical protein